jgi:hypothetical protein
MVGTTRKSRGLLILRTAYKEFEERLGQLGFPRGEKTGLVLRAIHEMRGTFAVSELQNECPNVSIDMIRRVLKNLKKLGKVQCLGRGQSAQWRKTSKWRQLDNTHSNR